MSDLSYHQIVKLSLASDTITMLSRASPKYRLVDSLRQWLIALYVAHVPTLHFTTIPSRQAALKHWPNKTQRGIHIHTAAFNASRYIYHTRLWFLDMFRYLRGLSVLHQDMTNIRLTIGQCYASRFRICQNLLR